MQPLIRKHLNSFHDRLQLCFFQTNGGAVSIGIGLITEKGYDFIWLGERTEGKPS